MCLYTSPALFKCNENLKKKKSVCLKYITAEIPECIILRNCVYIHVASSLGGEMLLLPDLLESGLSESCGFFLFFCPKLYKVFG